MKYISEMDMEAAALILAWMAGSYCQIHDSIEADVYVGSSDMKFGMNRSSQSRAKAWGF